MPLILHVSSRTFNWARASSQPHDTLNQTTIGQVMLSVRASDAVFRLISTGSFCHIGTNGFSQMTGVRMIACSHRVRFGIRSRLRPTGANECMIDDELIMLQDRCLQFCLRLSRRLGERAWGCRKRHVRKPKQSSSLAILRQWLKRLMLVPCEPHSDNVVQ